jgi:hypothetical protein
MNLRNRRDLKEKRQEVAEDQRRWEREEAIKISRKKQSEKNQRGQSKKKANGNEMIEEEICEKFVPGKDEFYSLTQVVNDYDSKNIKDKKLHEILKMIMSDKQEQHMMGIYALYQMQSSKGAEKDFSLKVHKSGAHTKIAEVMRAREDYRLTILKYLTAMFSIEVYPEVCLEVDLLFMPLLTELLSEKDFYYLCYGLNLIGKISKNHQRTQKETSSQRYKDLMKQVLSANEELNSQQSSDQILGVKYYVFNTLLENSSESIWPEFAFEWLNFTARIMNQGLIRNKKSKKFEAWLKSNRSVQQKVFNRHDQEIGDMFKIPSVGFYLLYLLDSQKSNLINLKGVRDLIQKELKSIPHAAV